MKFPSGRLAACCLSGLAMWLPAGRAETAPVHLTIKADQPGIKISPVLYGLMTEEINYSYDGGIYAELIQNRDFKQDKGPSTAHWSLVRADGAAGTMNLDAAQPVNTTALTSSLRLDITATAAGARVGIANDGYWGFPVRPDTDYQASFYARSSPGFGAPLTLSLENQDGTTTFALAQSPALTGEWQHYTVTLSSGDIVPAKANRFVISAAQKGTVWLSQVSLFPPTYHDRPNGNRVDLMQKLAAMAPSFLRFPGGNYLEGQTIAERFDWKKTLGAISDRPGHGSPWKYHSTDGLGLDEFLGWCEDLRMQPVLAVFAGFALGGEHVTGEQLEPFVQDALDEIEYVTGDASTPWGAKRAAAGHPAPYPLEFVEIGNEDNFDHSHSYDERFTRFYDAIKAKYPRLQIIATAPVKTRTPDVYDQHFYRSDEGMLRDVHHYDDFSRTGPKIFVGEWASQDAPQPWKNPETKGPTPSLRAALGDAAWMIGLERNSDVVLMQCYAPLLVNVNPGGRQWAVNLIGYDALNSFGSPSYYAETMFSNNRGDVVLPVSFVGAAAQAAEEKPQGSIGVGTWKTQAEFKDVEVTHGDDVLYRSDFSHGLDNWHLTRGEWQGTDGALRQAADQPDTVATAGDPAWGDYTVRLKARKISGEEGFLIRFHARNDANYLDFNVGGWGNRQHGIEKVHDGEKRILGGQVPGAIETGRWYDIRVDVAGTDIRCYLDGKLIIEAQDALGAPEPLIATASRELASGDVILKAVNTTAQPQQLQIDVQGGPEIAATATGQVLAGQLSDVNSLENPRKAAVRTFIIRNAARSFPYEFAANSVTVLRLKTK